MSQSKKGYLCECDFPDHHPVSCSEAEWEALDNLRPSGAFQIIDKRCPNLKKNKLTVVRTTKNLLLCRYYG
jgi:hypothetical protein